MALTITLSTSIATDRESWVLTDDTVYGTGGNPARSAVGVFVASYKMNYDNTVATTLDVTSDDDDEETDASWTIDYTVDGWYKTYFVIIPDFDNTDTYEIYDAVFNPSDNKVYRSKQNNNTEDTLTNTTWWEEITGANIAGLANNKDTATESANITSTIYQRVFRADSQYEFSNQLSDQSKFVDDDELNTLEDYILFAQWLDAAEVADSRSEVLDGEQICRRIQTKFID